MGEMDLKGDSSKSNDAQTVMAISFSSGVKKIVSIAGSLASTAEGFMF